MAQVHSGEFWLNEPWDVMKCGGVTDAAGGVSRSLSFRPTYFTAKWGSAGVLQEVKLRGPQVVEGGSDGERELAFHWHNMKDRPLEYADLPAGITDVLLPYCAQNNLTLNGAPNVPYPRNATSNADSAKQTGSMRPINRSSPEVEESRGDDASSVVSSTIREPRWVRDELILACDLVLRNDWKGIGANDERVRELSDLLQRIPIHPTEVRGPRFRNPNGVARKTYDIATRHPDYRGVPTKGGAGDLEVLRDFLEREGDMRGIAEMIRAGIDSGELVKPSQAVPDLDLEVEAREGRLLERRHLARERDSGLRSKKIERHLRTHGRLACETCGFDFEAVYGEHGDGYIECHHVVPLCASGETKTRLHDLILICSNCHRMIHRRTPWLTPEQLRDVIATKRQHFA
jgi:5-methylcytosine-specific restriction enzyme A